MPLAQIPLLPSSYDSGSPARDQARTWDRFCQRYLALGPEQLCADDVWGRGELPQGGKFIPFCHGAT